MKKNSYDRAARRTTQGPSAPIPRVKPIRVTLDLTPRQHRQLKRWCNAAAVELDLAEVKLAPVLRILGDQLINDEQLTQRVHEILLSKEKEL